jgi:5-(carboxyamino)imidazole ribonucleotide mutase
VEVAQKSRIAIEKTVEWGFFRVVAGRAGRRSVLWERKNRRAKNGRMKKKKSASAAKSREALVGIIMGSTSDWKTMEHTADTLRKIGVPFEARVVSAHRTPDLLFEYSASAEKRGIEVIIAGAGGAAHLPGMAASKTVLPVLGVPVESKALKGLDSLLSIAQMPGGIPVGTLAIGKAGAINAALLASAILGAKHAAIRESLRAFRIAQTKKVLSQPDPAAAARKALNAVHAQLSRKKKK